ncbi:MAG: nitrile hydratase subunit alpha [Burkholderiales bacterium]
MSHSRDGVPPAPVSNRVRALEDALSAKQLVPDDYFENTAAHTEKEFDSRNGAKAVAKAWVDPAYRVRLLADGAAASAELGFNTMNSEHLVVLENTPTLHNVIVCTQCSCTAWSMLGLPPDWYKSPEYRARIVREPRALLGEMGLDLRAETSVRVWDTSGGTRYFVLPLRPQGTEGWSEERLASIVSREAMIGVARVEVPPRR